MPRPPTVIVEAMVNGILQEMHGNPDLGREEFIADAAEVFGTIMPEETEPVETQMLGLATMIGVLLWRAHCAEGPLEALSQAYTDYQDRLRRREHGGVAADRLTNDVAQILGRSQYEFQTQ